MTKGELMKILDRVFNAGIGYERNESTSSSGHLKMFPTEAADAILALHATKTAKLQAEILREVLHETGGKNDARWTFENVKRRLSQLEREHKIGEDGERD